MRDGFPSNLRVFGASEFHRRFLVRKGSAKGRLGPVFNGQMMVKWVCLKMGYIPNEIAI